MVAHAIADSEVGLTGGRAGEAQSPLTYAVDIVDLSKSFQRRSLRSSYTTIKSVLLRLFRSEPTRPGLVTHAIRDLTLRIPQGASVGIIGRNGSGKSTFLKLVTGIYKPDEGKIKVSGRIAALIELGAGLHPDFSGRENLYLGGVMHGLSKKEIDARFDDIVRFAELEGVIDDPVRTYSSGMFMRLGFSLAIHTDPDILIIDEVMAVGDVGFVAKCKDRINELRKNGKTLILVSHDLDSVERWCDEALWLHAGEVRDRGDPRRVIDHYREFIERGEEAELLEASQHRHIQPEVPEESPEDRFVDSQGRDEQPRRWGSREIEITDVQVRDENGSSKLLFHPHDPMTVEISYTLNGGARDLVFGVGINRGDGLTVFGTNTDIEGVRIPEALSGSGKIHFSIDRIGLLEGSYDLDVAVHRTDGYPYDYHKGIVQFVVRTGVKMVGVFEPPHKWRIDV